MKIAPVRRIIPNSLVDGSGNRTAIFLQGCNLRCDYCHNPETQKIYSYESSDANSQIRWMTAEEVFNEIDKDIPFIRGITLSGGECTLYPQFIKELFILGKKAGLSCLIDSNGTIDFSLYPDLMEVCDGVMLDVKAWDKNKFKVLRGIGFNTADPLAASAKMNPELSYAIVDHEYGDDILPNVICAVFDVEEASFIVGYIAGLTTETNKVAYIGGMRSPVMDLFEYGFKSGVDYAAKELGKEIQVEVQIAESFTDAAKGKAIAASLYSGGCDVIFPAAGATGNGVIEQAIEDDKWVIGVDRDQLYLAPDNILTSALKHVGAVTKDISKRVVDGEDLGGQVIKYGLANGGVGIPENNPNMDPQVYEKAMEIQKLIIDGEIDPPHNEETYQNFLNNLQ